VDQEAKLAEIREAAGPFVEALANWEEGRLPIFTAGKPVSAFRRLATALTKDAPT
jgi:hypothetical protein